MRRILFLYRRLVPAVLSFCVGSTTSLLATAAQAADPSALKVQYFAPGNGSPNNGPTFNTPFSSAPISNPPTSNPPISNPPISNPPISNPPISNPAISNPPPPNVGHVPDSIRPASNAAVSSPPATPLSLPFFKTNPFSALGAIMPRSASPYEAAIKDALSMPPRNIEPCRFYRIEPEGDQNAKAGDYLANLLHDVNGRVAHFTSMPIPVYFPPLPNPLMQSCFSALDMWELRSQGLVRFVQVNDPRQARIQVRWLHQGLDENSDGAVTQMRWNGKGRGVPLVGHRQSGVTVAPQVVNVNLDVLSNRLPEDQGMLLRNILAHEIGHALGIQTHSAVQGDLMYSDTDEYSRISERDLNTLRKLYQMPTDLPL